MSIRYPFLDLGAATAPLRDEIVAAVTRVIDSGRYIGGDECQSFQSELAAMCGVKHCVGVSNGLDALRLIFRSLLELERLSVGDKVVIPGNTYIASVLAVTDMGLEPVLVDPDPVTMNLDWHKAEMAVDNGAKAVLTVHLYGRVAWDADVCRRLRDRGVVIIEDNAQAIGATTGGVMTGALGDAAAFSFYPTKNVGALGDAGAVTTNDADLANMVRTLANYGSDRRYHNITCGYNCRMDPIQAAILRVKLQHINAENKRRRHIARIYNDNISNPDITLPLWADDDMVWHQYVVAVSDRDRFTAYLDANGIGWDVHYATPPHRQPCYESLSATQLPVTEHLADRIVSLPAGASTTSDDAFVIADIVSRYV